MQCLFEKVNQFYLSPKSYQDASCFKKGLLEKQQSVPNTCNISPLKKIFFQNTCIFQISLKYKKLVIPKILFILVLHNCNFFLIMWTPKILFILVLCKFNFFKKIMWPPSNITPPPQAWGRGVHSMSCICTWNKLIKAKAISPLTFFF